MTNHSISRPAAGGRSAASTDDLLIMARSAEEREAAAIAAAEEERAAARRAVLTRRLRLVGLAGVSAALFFANLAWTRISRDRQLIDAVSRGDSASVSALLAAGASAAAPVAAGRPVILAAAGRGDADTVRALVRQGADADLGAVEAALRGRSSVVRLLVEMGATVSGEKGGRLLAAAAQGGDVHTLRYVLSLGAPLEYRATDPPSEAGMTPVMYAARSGKPGVVYTLVKAGADIRARDGSGKTLLMHAALWNAPDACRLLVANGLRPDDRDDDGRTALMHAAHAGRFSTLDYLLRAKSDVGLRDRTGKTALDLAVENGDERCVNRLRNAGAVR